ncbi:uncharacterized protein LOC134781731 [Penaeus indicus]|uniref:uncharacterized protein LOC134781731 n=1 Tax=Penaeus indicus TaxID=29960 RepID=UPI00300D2C52
MSPKRCPGPWTGNSKGRRRTRPCEDPAHSLLVPPPQPPASDLESSARASFSGEEVTAQQTPPSKRNPAARKLYEITEPFSDPVEERKRINAIAARENRERKKRENDQMCEQIQRLNHVNRQCTKALKRFETEIKKLDAKLKTSQRRNEHLEEKLKQKEKELRDRREKFLLFRGHLELITSHLDDSNPAKKLITGLLKLPKS